MTISFLLNNLGHNQLAFNAIQASNDAIRANDELDVVLYYENLTRPCMGHGFMISNVLDAWTNSGVVVATSLSNASKLLSFPNAQRKLFYVYDLEWTLMQQKSYEELARIYQNPMIELIARSHNHKQVLEKLWNRPVRVIENFNVKEFLRVNQP